MPIIKTVKGDLLNATEPFVAHGVNCLGLMGAGVARSIAAKWPASELKYREYCFKFSKKPSDLLGRSLATHEKQDNKVLFHLFTQENYGTDSRKVNYGAIGRSFSELNNTLKVMRDFDKHMEKETKGDPEQIGIPVVAIPRIGAGLGGGDWALIEEIINGCTPDIAVVVYDI